MLTIKDGTIVAVTPYAAKDTIKAVPAGRWMPKEKAWGFPASPWSARNLIDAVGRYGVSPEVEALAAKAIPVRDIVAMAETSEVQVSSLMRYQPRSNQRVGALMLRMLEGCILGWGMGAGKTYGLISGMADKIDQARSVKGSGPGAGVLAKFFIAAPVAVVDGVWPGEIRKHLIDWHQHLEVSAMPAGTSTTDRIKDAKRKLKWAEKSGRAFLFVTGYESCIYSVVSDFVADHLWDIGALDEIHRATTPGAKLTRWVDTTLAPRALTRVGLSGTLMRNGPLDVFCPIRFVDPGVLGRSASKFKEEHAILDHFGAVRGVKDQDELLEKVGKVAHFVKTRDVVDMPPDIPREWEFNLTDGRAAYDAMEKTCVLEVGEGRLTAANGLVKLLRLQQITSGFLPLQTEDGREVTTDIDRSKRDALEAVVAETPTDEPIVVFTVFKSDVRCVREIALNAGRKCYELTGDANELQAWQQDDGPSVIAANIKSAREGVDFTRACHAVFFSVGYSNADHQQAIARLVRPGQKSPVLLTYLVARKTVDEKVIGALIRKQNAVEAAVAFLKEHQSATSRSED